MSILALQIFVSLCLVAGAVVLYVYTVRARTFDHSDRLALAPLDDDERRRDPSTPLDDDERPRPAPEPKPEPAAPPATPGAPLEPNAEVRP